MRIEPLVGVLLAVCALNQPLSSQGARLDHFGAAPARLHRLCDPKFSADRKVLLQRESDLRARSELHTASDSVWRAYGCTLSLLYAAAAFDPKPPHASQYAVPAIDAFLHVLDVNPGDTLAITAIATIGFEIAEGLEVPSIVGYADEFARISYNAVHAGVTEPIVLRMCTEFSLLRGRSPSSRYCNGRALALGVDSTWQFVRSAWLAFLVGDKAGGVAAFDRAIAAAHDSAQRGEAIARVRALIDEQPPSSELSAMWASLSDSGRVAWVHQHLAIPADMRDASYGDVVARYEGNRFTHGPLFTACPASISWNGATPARVMACAPTAGPKATSMPMVAALKRVWDPVSQKPIGLLTVGLDQSYNVGIRGIGSTGKADVDFTMQLWEWERARWTDSTFQLHLEIPNTVFRPPYTATLLQVAAPEGTYSWTATAAQGSRLGRISIEEGVRASMDSSIALSDLILGAPSQNLSWITPADTVVLAPWNALPPGKPFELYFQVRNRLAPGDFDVQMNLRRIVGGIVTEKPELAVKFMVQLNTGINPNHQRVDISRLTAGDYQLEVQLVDAAGHLVTQRKTNLLLRNL